MIATLLYKSKARKEKDEQYIEWADEFQSLAVEILEKFYVTNAFECTQAIIREIPQFGNVTWLHLAVMAEAKLFIAEKAVQDVLSDIWYKNQNFLSLFSFSTALTLGMVILIIGLEIRKLL